MAAKIFTNNTKLACHLGSCMLVQSMHTRRLSSFILGAWLLGSLFTAFIASQSFANVERIMNNPPSPVAKDMEDLGSDITRQLLRYQASELNRFLFETWGVVQLGMGAAFLSASVLTSHRSKFLILVSALMMVLVAISTFYILPTMNVLGRSFDFLPLAAAPVDRANHASYHLTYLVMEVLKLLLGLSLAARLLFDRYGWKQKLLPLAPASKTTQRRRRRSTPLTGDLHGPTTVEQPVDAVNNPDDSHVDR